jgi:curved DNA-binding protein
MLAHFGKSDSLLDGKGPQTNKSMPARYRDYYETLGVAKDASQDAIRDAFRKLARKYHPDVAKDKSSAEAKFKEINEAYEVLGDPEKRKKYDALGPDWERMAAGGAAGGGVPPGWEQAEWGEAGGVEFEFGGTGFSDFFEQIFGTRRTGRAAGAGSGVGGFSARGQDIESDILVSLEEALHGSTRRISFRRAPGGQTETYTVRIPKGVRAGQRIRLAGIGGAGIGGGSAGDFYLRVKYERHPEFEVEGVNLLHEADVPVWTAALGGSLAIPTLEGKAVLRIPAGAREGQKFRLAGKGLPRASGTRGDLLVKARIAMPISPPNENQTRLWRELARAYGETT